MKYYGTILSDYDIVNKGYVDANIPTKTSDLTNDSDFATNSSLNTGLNNKVNLSGDTMTGELIVNNVSTAATGFSVTASGNIVAGSTNKTTYSMIATTRKCANDGNNANTASFFTNSDGTAKFCHKRGDTTGKDDAYMLFDATGFKVAYSGTKGTTASTEYVLLDTNKSYIKTEIDSKDLATLTSAKAYTDEKITALSTVAGSGSYNDLTDKPTIPDAYTLPVASSTELGGIKVGSNLNIVDSVLSAVLTTLSDLGITASATELNYVKGVTSAIQTQLNTKASTSDIPTTLPASDVYAWAKAATKPTYTASEVGAFPLNGNDLSLTQSGTATSHIINWDSATYIRNMLANGNYKDFIVNDSGMTWNGNTVIHTGNISSYAGGVDIKVQSAQPSGQSSGDFWFQVV